MENGIDLEILILEEKLKKQKYSKSKAIKFLQKLESEYIQRITKIKADYKDTLEQDYSVISELMGGNSLQDQIKRQIQEDYQWVQKLRELQKKIQDDPEFEDKKNTSANNYQRKKIMWNGTEAQLIALFEILNDAELINEYNIKGDRQWLMIVNHFKNKKGNNFKPKQISSVYANSDIKTEKTDLLQLLRQKLST